MGCGGSGRLTLGFFCLCCQLDRDGVLSLLLRLKEGVRAKVRCVMSCGEDRVLGCVLEPPQTSSSLRAFSVLLGIFACFRTYPDARCCFEVILTLCGLIPCCSYFSR
jgi:hypothetical protein